MTHTKHTTALQLIQQGWTQDALARDKLGYDVGFNNDDAVCWCSLGAITAAYGYGSLFVRATERLEEVVGMSIDLWNDKPGRTQAEVIDAFAKAGI